MVLYPVLSPEIDEAEREKTLLVSETAIQEYLIRPPVSCTSIYKQPVLLYRRYLAGYFPIYRKTEFWEKWFRMWIEIPHSEVWKEILLGTELDLAKMGTVDIDFRQLKALVLIL